MRKWHTVNQRRFDRIGEHMLLDYPNGCQRPICCVSPYRSHLTHKVLPNPNLFDLWWVNSSPKLTCYKPLESKAPGLSVPHFSTKITSDRLVRKSPCLVDGAMPMIALNLEGF